uniref:Thyroid stimulating hormone subunit beta n=1 Tax=Oncorhynchus mykiss TaxID=8022 RepID=A0A8C7NS97_ONCMY
LSSSVRVRCCVPVCVSVCMMENYTLLMEKRGCSQCIAVNTTICSGFCHTQDTNVKGRVGKSYLIQRGCMPHSLVYHPARVSGCPLHVNNVLYYPESRRCHCTRCDGHAHRSEPDSVSTHTHTHTHTLRSRPSNNTLVV